MTRHAYIVAGMVWGDEGKGATVDYLVRVSGSRLVVRYNGGHQAGHNVVLPDGRHHTFSQFGSGTLAGANTFLSKYMLMDPISMMKEAEHLKELGVENPFSMLTVDCEAVVVTPFHKAVNRIKELLRGAERHGSCGRGIGEARYDQIHHPKITIHAGDIANWRELRDKLHALQYYNRAKVEKLDLTPLLDGHDKSEMEVLLDDRAVDWCLNRYRRWPAWVVQESPLRFVESVVIFEGAQGVLLDEQHGEEPYRTWTNTTFGNALEILNGHDFETRKIGVFRTYFTRHGPGPFPSEDDDLKISERHNEEGKYQGKFRIGVFDWVLAKRAMDIMRPDLVALNHADRWCPAGMATAIKKDLRVEVGILGTGPTWRDRQEMFGHSFQPLANAVGV